MTTPTLLLTPRRTALLADHDNALDVLVRVQAPDLPAEQVPKRSPLNIALVIDRSGSMSGQPLDEAKRCAEFVIDGLTAADHASLVVYDNNVNTLVPLTALTDREVFRRAIRAVTSGGMTNLHGGWLAGAETLAPHTSAESISRVILLSDGCANQGLTDTPVIATQCQQLADAGVSTSTYGLGRDFNEELMVAMARAGRGNNYYGQTAEDLMDPFREEFALLNALCARGLQLKVEAADGVRMELLNDYTQSAESTWRLPDLAYDAEAWALVRLHLTKEQVASLGSSDPACLLTASVRYDDIAGEPRAIQPQSLALPALPAAAFGAIAEDALVKRRAEELEAARLQEAAREAALRGDWPTVERLMKTVEALGADNEWVREIVVELGGLVRRRDEAMFAKESRYTARRMASRLASRDEMTLPANADVPDFVRRKSAQGKRDPRSPR
jgi:Ca-activated chloride channel family protein